MPKAKGKTRRQKFGYIVNRKRLNRIARRKAAPRIEWWGDRGLEGRRPPPGRLVRWQSRDRPLFFPVAHTSDMPGTRPNRCGRTWPRWVWLWTPTGQCPFLRERYWRGPGLALRRHTILSWLNPVCYLPQALFGFATSPQPARPAWLRWDYL